MEAVADKLHAAAPKAFVEIGYRWTRHTTDFRAQVCVHMLNILLGLYGRKGGVLLNRSVHFGGLPVEFPKPDMRKSILKWKIDNQAGALARQPGGRQGRHHPGGAGRQTIQAQDVISLGPGHRRGNGRRPGCHGCLQARGVDRRRVPVLVGQRDVRGHHRPRVHLPRTGSALFQLLQESHSRYRRQPQGGGTGHGQQGRILDPVPDRQARLGPEEYNRYFRQLEQEGLRPTWESQFAGITQHGKSGLTPEELSTLPRTLDDLLERGSWGTGRSESSPIPPKTATGKFEVYSFELAEKYDMLGRTHPDYPDRIFASPLPELLEPRWMLQKPKLGDDEFVPATGFTPLSSFAGAQARDNPILVALHHRMRYANVFINAERARRLGLEEGDRVEIWMPEHPDEKQQAVLSVSQIIHLMCSSATTVWARACRKRPRKFSMPGKTASISTISAGSGFARGLRAYAAGHRFEDQEGVVMRYLTMYDSISCLNCLACMSACSMENRMRSERDAGVSIERGVNEYLPGSYYLRPWRREVGKYPDSRLLVAFEHCRHCEHAQCLIHCPARPSNGDRPGRWSSTDRHASGAVPAGTPALSTYPFTTTRPARPGSASAATTGWNPECSLPA